MKYFADAVLYKCMLYIVQVHTELQFSAVPSVFL